MRNAKWIAAAAFAVHMAFSLRYGFFRDELYFIACGRHFAFGYADQPPIVPWFAALSQAFGQHLWAIRLIPSLAHAATIVAVAALAELYEERAAVPAALLAALAPMYWGLHTVFNTTCFDPLLWTLFAYCVATDRWVWAGVIAGVDMEIKYAFPFFAVPLFLGAHGKQKLLLKSALIAAVIAAPSVIWQWQHGFPFLTLTRMAADKNEYTPPISFLINQVMVMNPLLFPLWFAGLIYGLVTPRARFLAIAFLGVLVEMIALHGKDYYTAPAYGLVFALGGAAVAKWLHSGAAKALWFSAAGALTAIVMPTSLPVIDPPDLPGYLAKMHLEVETQEKSTRGSAIPQELADMLGWPELEERVAAVWSTLPDKTRAGIFASNYGEAGAIDFFGPRHALPPVRCPHNSYGLWGRNQPELDTLVIVGKVDSWRPRCKDIDIKAYGGVELSVPIEKGRPIFVCHLQKPLSTYWSDLEFIY
jgi:hypothetical protein